MRVKHTKLHKDGSIWATGYLLDGKMDGFWKFYRKDGTKMRTGYFNKGLQTKDWMTYDKTGKLVKKTTLSKI